MGTGKAKWVKGRKPPNRVGGVEGPAKVAGGGAPASQKGGRNSPCLALDVPARSLLRAHKL